MKLPRTADDLLALLHERGGAIVRGGEIGPLELAYAHRTGQAYTDELGREFVHRPPRAVRAARKEGSRPETVRSEPSTLKPQVSSLRSFPIVFIVCPAMYA